jgi:hypothetical protein
MRTFRKKTIANSDDVFISPGAKYIQVRKVFSVPKKDKKGNHIGFDTVHREKIYPNTKANREKAESVVGKLRQEKNAVKALLEK